jgi:hypothetical protein
MSFLQTVLTTVVPQTTLLIVLAFLAMTEAISAVSKGGSIPTAIAQVEAEFRRALGEAD